MAVAAGGALVIVNTVVYVQAALGLGERHTAINPRKRGVARKIRTPRVNRSVKGSDVVFGGLGSATNSTSAADTPNPTAVPAKSQ